MNVEERGQGALNVVHNWWLNTVTLPLKLFSKAETSARYTFYRLHHHR